MSSVQQRILAFIDNQLDAMSKRPGMWGPNIAVERQAILLLELRSIILRPGLEESNPRVVLNAYSDFVARTFPDAPPLPLSTILARAGRSADLGSLLGAFCNEVVAGMIPESIFSGHDLVLALWLREGVNVPRASTLSSYYDVFRRVLRAVSRPHGSRGRAKHDIEQAIDFVVSEIAVVPANGVPAHLVLPLDQLPHLSTQGADSVKSGLDRIALLNEWAANERESVHALEGRLEGKEVAQRVAAQTLRLMSSTEEAVQVVEMGGKLVGNRKPVRMVAKQAERLVEVVKESAELTAFDEIGSVRAVDMDQRSMRLRLSRPVSGISTIQCWMDEPRLVELASQALGQGDRIRVSGRMYKDPGSPAMVIVAKIQF